MRLEVKEYDNNVPENNVLVSVIVMAFNHEKYIFQCLESILNQKTNFIFEIILGEDESSDNTRSICIHFAEKYPNKIRLILHSRENVIKINGNPTGRFNFMYGLKKANGKYIALCDGDDYWIDSYKLQKQVDFLKSNTDYSMCFTRYKRYFQDTNLFQISGHNKSKVYKLKDFMYANHAATATVLFRKFQFNKKNLVETPFVDWTFYNLILKKGNAYYMDDVTAVYRRHSYNSEFYNPTSYKKKLYVLNFIFLKIHGIKYLIIFFKKIIQMSIFNKLH